MGRRAGVQASSVPASSSVSVKGASGSKASAPEMDAGSTRSERRKRTEIPGTTSTAPLGGLVNTTSGGVVSREGAVWNQKSKSSTSLPANPCRERRSDSACPA